MKAMTHHRFILALLLVTIKASCAVASQADAKVDKSKIKSLIEMVSALRFRMAKSPASLECGQFVKTVCDSTVAQTFEQVRGKDQADRFDEIIELVRARADSFERSSPLAGAGLRSLVSFMQNCAGRVQADEIALKELALAREQVEHLERQQRDLALAIREQLNQRPTSREPEEESERRELREKISNIREDFAIVTLEKESWEVVATVNHDELIQCREACDRIK
jgi:hypothetical protein